MHKRRYGRFDPFVIGAITSAFGSIARKDIRAILVALLFLGPVQDLPIDAHLRHILAAVRDDRAAVVVAAPGAGKTTRVPPALVEDGRVLLLQPRRVAARAIARRIAEERQWSLGHEVGWHIRLDRRFTNATKLIVATEGILTARLQRDPLLQEFRTIVIDEFHERSVHADVGLALAREAWRARGDLRVVVMSATINARQVAEYLDGCPIIEVPGRLHPLDVSHHPHLPIEDAVAQARAGSTGAILCFLPGAAEIQRAAEAIAGRAALAHLPVSSLHGSLGADEQDAALRPTGGPRVVLATNIAETTLTVPDVTCVIDSGLQKVARYDPARAIDTLEIERVSQDSADQRAGRAGRLQAGTVLRLWDSRQRLAPHREPEIRRVDLSPVVMDVLAWGGHPSEVDWFEAPPGDALNSAIALLGRLGAVDRAGHLTPLGRQLMELPLPPRLARMLIAADGAPEMALACGLLSEKSFVPPRRSATQCDLLSTIDHPRALPSHVRRVAESLASSARVLLGDRARSSISDESFRRAVLAGYPDRVGRRREPGGDRFVLASGTGARLGAESGVLSAEFIVAVDMGGSRTARTSEALVRLATAIEPDWIDVTDKRLDHEFDPSAGTLRAVQRDLYDQLVIRERPSVPDPETASGILLDEYRTRGPDEDDRQLLRRAAFAGVSLDLDALAAAAVGGAKRLDQVRLRDAVDGRTRRMIDDAAPVAWRLPAGRDVRLEYRDDGAVVASVQLQLVFGLRESPRLGPRRVPVTFELLAPNQRPIQVTRDLASFWSRGYAEVRKELRGRYPKHRWPEDPLSPDAQG